MEDTTTDKQPMSPQDSKLGKSDGQDGPDQAHPEDPPRELPETTSDLGSTNPSTLSSDEDSLIQDLETTPLYPKRPSKITPPSLLGSMSADSLLRDSSTEEKTVKPSQKLTQRKPALTVITGQESNEDPHLSPNEELTLLAVKNKPNSPDRDVDAAPSPPRKNHKHAAVKQYPNFLHGAAQANRNRAPIAGTTNLTVDVGNEPVPEHDDDDDDDDGEVIEDLPKGGGAALTPMAASNFLHLSPAHQAHLISQPSINSDGYIGSSNSSGTSIPLVDVPPMPRNSFGASPTSQVSDANGVGSTYSNPETARSQLELGESSYDYADANPSSLPPGGRSSAKVYYHPTVPKQEVTAQSTPMSHTSKYEYIVDGKTNPMSVSQDDFSDAGEDHFNYASNYLKPTKTAPASTQQESLSPTSTSSSQVTPASNSYAADLDIATSSSSTNDTEGVGLSPVHHGFDDHVHPHGNTIPLGEYAITHEKEMAAHQRELRRREAVREAEARLMAATTTESKMVSDYDDPPSHWMFYCCIFICMVAAVVAASIVVVSRGDKTSDDLKINDRCSRAIEISTVDEFPVLGEIQADTRARLDSTCEVEQGAGHTLWYFLDGTDNLLSLSTCGDATGVDDTKMLVFSGSCQSLQCVAGSDRLCENHGAVAWKAETGTRYFIVIQGTQESSAGQVSLSLSLLNENDSCTEAALVITSETPVFGSTRDMQLNEQPATCTDDTSLSSASAWYQLEGDGSLICASAISESTEFPSFPLALSVFQGNDCSDLSCLATVGPSDDPWLTQNSTFMAEVGSTYFLTVQGQQDLSVGDFFLNLLPAPFNGICEHAATLDVGTSMQGSTVDACLLVEPTVCSEMLDHPGVWYLVEGTGELMIAQITGLTCEEDDEIQSRIIVFDGNLGCSARSCTEFVSLVCTAGNQKVTSQWFSQAGEYYYLFVQSSESAVFDISLEEFIPGGSDTCVNATDIELSGESTLGTTIGANPSDLDGCPESGAAGVWYFVEGTGGPMEASTCNTGTNYSTGITILEGECGTFQCVDATVITCDGERSMAFWNSTLGQSYSVYVHGQDEDDSGRFHLTISETPLRVANDFCGSATALEIPSTTLGSTSLALSDNVDDFCGHAVTAPGVWYTVVGRGATTTASLCGDATRFDSRIYVFQGESCNELDCIAFNEDACGTRSRISWQAEAGVEYHLLVSGFNTEVGDFELVVF